MQRKNFIKAIALNTGAMVLSPKLLAGNRGKCVLRFGIMADLHHDLIFDGEQRLEQFIDEMQVWNPDFIIQLGDFCVPKNENSKLLNIWNLFQKPKYHVIGNHDRDGGYSYEELLNFWDMPSRYYTFETNHIQCIVLDGNEENKAEKTVGYPRYISDEQLQWLRHQLGKTDKPAIIFCHQGLDNDLDGIKAGVRVRAELERVNKQVGYKKVFLVLSGHHHQDYHNIINGINYVQINSMSYFWLGEQYKQKRFDDITEKKYPFLRYTAPYRDPLWAKVEVFENGNIKITGRDSSYVSPSPSEIGVDLYIRAYGTAPVISSFYLK